MQQLIVAHIMEFNTIFDGFLLSSSIFKETNIKIARKYKGFTHPTEYPKNFCENFQFWDIAFVDFLTPKNR